MRKEVGISTIHGKADRCMYSLGNNMVFVDRVHEAKRDRPYVWMVRESRKHTKKRADETGGIAYPHIHVSTLKPREIGHYESHGKALLAAINYLNRKRKEGEI